METTSAKRIKDVKQSEIDAGKVFIQTGFGKFKVIGITKDLWVNVCNEKGEFIQSFCCHSGDMLTIKEDDDVRVTIAEIKCKLVGRMKPTDEQICNYLTIKRLLENEQEVA